MKRTLCLVLSLILCLLSPLSASVLAEAAVPDELPADLGGKTLYGYLMELKNQYMPATVFTDAVKYTDEDRENAKRAAKLTVDATTAKMEASGPDSYMLYLRAYAYEQQYLAGGDAAMQAAGLADYQKTVELGGAYAQADYDRLAATVVAAGPLSWQVPQMLTLAEMAALLGVAEGDLCYVASDYQTADGSRQGVGYTLRADTAAAAAIYVLADPQGGQARYDLLKGMAFLHAVTALDGVGDEAAAIGLRNMDNDPTLYTTVLARKDELVLQVRVPAAAWKGADTVAAARAVAEALLANLYDTERAVPDEVGITMENAVTRAAMNPGTADSPVPDALPADLGGKTEYGYLVEMRTQYLPSGAWEPADLSADGLNNARRAAKLISETITSRFDAYGQNPYELEIRAACYAFAYRDTGDEVWRKLAINDYKQALSTGYVLAKSGYDALATPLLSPMAELMSGAEGDGVTLLNRWLIQAGYLAGSPGATFDDATRQAVECYEADNGLTPDGIADIAMLLSLYAKIDDGDATLPGA